MNKKTIYLLLFLMLCSCNSSYFNDSLTLNSSIDNEKNTVNLETSSDSLSDYDSLTAMTSESLNNDSTEDKKEYEETPSLICIPNEKETEFALEEDITKSIYVGDFYFNIDDSRHFPCFYETNHTINGQRYIRRINVKSSYHSFSFYASKAGKLEIIAYSSVKYEEREALLFSEEYSYSTIIPMFDVSTFDNLSIVIEFDSPGIYNLKTKLGAWHFYAAYVYYAI